MMTWIFAGLIALGVIWGGLTGQMSAVSSAAVSSTGKAVELMLTLMGTMCFWSGIMNVADKAGLTGKLSNFFAPVTQRLFPGLKKEGAALKAISMNLAANLLGLGNAATPLGIAAMSELAKVEHQPKAASNHMVLFVVLNTASLQLIPTTVAMLRQNAGSSNPMEILPAVWIASLIAVCSGVLTAKLLAKLWRN